jgi:hypothetical protein
MTRLAAAGTATIGMDSPPCRRRLNSLFQSAKVIWRLLFGGVGALFQVGHSGLKVRPDPGPTDLNQEYQDGYGNGADDQDRFQADCALFVLVDLSKQLPERGLPHIFAPFT